MPNYRDITFGHINTKTQPSSAINIQIPSRLVSWAEPLISILPPPHLMSMVTYKR